MHISTRIAAVIAALAVGCSAPSAPEEHPASTTEGLGDDIRACQIELDDCYTACQGVEPSPTEDCFSRCTKRFNLCIQPILEVSETAAAPRR